VEVDSVSKRTKRKSVLESRNTIELDEPERDPAEEVVVALRRQAIATVLNVIFTNSSFRNERSLVGDAVPLEGR
jgi:hypothetical protein